MPMNKQTTTKCVLYTIWREMKCRLKFLKMFSFHYSLKHIFYMVIKEGFVFCLHHMLRTLHHILISFEKIMSGLFI